MAINEIEAKLRMVMDKLSNGEAVEYEDAWVEAAGEMFKEGLRKQLNRENGPFRLRMSNIGRPVCQLQREKAGVEPIRMPYNHIMRMMYGDAVECIVELLLRIAGVNITGGKSQAEYKIAGTVIKGENDIEIDGATWDTKSASPWAYINKWSEGYSALSKSDDFGYIPQLVGYSKGTPTRLGGWIVANKVSGELSVVPATPSDKDLKQIEENISATITLVNSDKEFIRCFEPVTEYFRKVPTGNKRLHTTCTFCSYRNSCWPDAQYKPQAQSKAANPPYYWYTKYTDSESPTK